VCRAPQTTSESGKNASGQEAFGSKAKETPVVESSAVSTADVTSAVSGTGATTASAAEKTGRRVATSTWLAHGKDRCLYVGTPWEVEVVANCRDVEEFKEASLTIRCVLSVRVLA
jgi:hypothetical protein